MNTAAHLARCEAEIAFFRRIVMTGELSPYCDPQQPGAAVADCIGALVGMSDWQAEAELIRARESANLFGDSVEISDNGGSEAAPCTTTIRPLSTSRLKGAQYA
jgi:hypothetical protein